MGRVFVCLLLTVLCAVLGKAQNHATPINGESRGFSKTGEDDTRKIRVDGKVVTQTYCDARSSLYSVSMEISLRFTNLSDRPAILSRKLPSPSEVRVAKTPEALRSQMFEYNPNLDPAVARLPRSPSLGHVPDSRYFTILRPKESFEAQVSTVVFGTQTGKKGFVEKGKHVLQLGMETWPYQWPISAPIDAHKLADEWSEYGHLVTGFLYTEPIDLTIPEDFKEPPCP